MRMNWALSSGQFLTSNRNTLPYCWIVDGKQLFIAKQGHRCLPQLGFKINRRPQSVTILESKLKRVIQPLVKA